MLLSSLSSITRGMVSSSISLSLQLQASTNDSMWRPTVFPSRLLRRHRTPSPAARSCVIACHWSMSCPLPSVLYADLSCSVTRPVYERPRQFYSRVAAYRRILCLRFVRAFFAFLFRLSRTVLFGLIWKDRHFVCVELNAIFSSVWQAVIMCARAHCSCAMVLYSRLEIQASVE